MNAAQQAMQDQINVEIEITISAYEEGEVSIEQLAQMIINHTIPAWKRAAYVTCYEILRSK